MSQRMIAAVVAGPLAVLLLLVAALTPLDYVTYRPGETVNALGTNNGKEIVEVKGHKVYRDDGALRMTTVRVSGPETKNTMLELVATWFDRDNAVMPYSSVYQKNTTEEQNEKEGAAQMTSSQDAAVAVALEELGYDILDVVVAGVEKGKPAAEVLEVDDIITTVDGAEVSSIDDVIDAVDGSGGKPVRLGVLRGTKKLNLSVTPVDEDGKPRIGVQLGIHPEFDLPVDVHINIDPAIGGPSAGLMFSLAIYDTLTPGSLTGGESIAGTGEIALDGSVGPIGGIDQKIAGARDDGAGLFLVPPDNCDDAENAQNGDMRLTVTPTMSDAVDAIEKWVDAPDADLPTCADLTEKQQ